MRRAAFFLTFCITLPLRAELPHYELQSRVAREDGTLEARVTITLPPAPETHLILGGTYRITHAAATGASVSVAPTDKPWRGLQRITVRSRLPLRRVKVELRYAGPLGPTGTPPLNTIAKDLVELNLDGMWVPVVEGFTTRFTLDATIEGIPRDLAAIAPGKITRDGRRIVIDRGDDVDVAFVAMRGMDRVSVDGFELYAIEPHSELSQLYIHHGTRALAFLESWFGELPGRPARVVVVRRPRESGYARRGYIVVSEARRAGGEARRSSLRTSSRTRGGRRSIRIPSIAGCRSRSPNTCRCVTSNRRWALPRAMSCSCANARSRKARSRSSAAARAPMQSSTTKDRCC